MQFLKNIYALPWLRVVEIIGIPVGLALISLVQWQASQASQRYTILSDYFDDMTQLQLSTELRGNLSYEELSEEQQIAEDANGRNSEKARAIARAMTLGALRQLGNDGERKGQLLKFLAEGDLIGDRCESINSAVATSSSETSDKCLPLVALKDAKLHKTQLDSPIELRGADLTKALLSEADLTRIDLAKAWLNDAELENTNLRGAILADAELKRANLKDANLIGATLQRAELNNANLTRAKLQKADLRNAKLTGANLEGAYFQGAIYNKDTAFPEGFDPIAERMKLCTSEEDCVQIISEPDPFLDVMLPSLPSLQRNKSHFPYWGI